MASDDFKDEGAALVDTPAKANKVSVVNKLCSLTNIANQLEIHAERAEGRIRKVTQLVEDSADDIAEDRDSIDFKALIKTAMPQGTEDALQKIHGAHERIAAAYEVSTPAANLTFRVKEFEQEAAKTLQDMLRLKEQTGKSGDVQKMLEDQHKTRIKGLEDQIAAVTKQKGEEVAAKVAEKQREFDEAKIAHQKAFDAVTKEREDAKAQAAAKQTELETANKEKAGIQANLQTVTKQKDTAEQKVVTHTQGLKALGVLFDGKDLKAVDEKTARDMLQAIQAKLTELAK